LFDLDPTLQDVWVEGEVSNFTRASSGHLYFHAQDDKSELRCVMWKGEAARLSFDPQHGDAVIAHGDRGLRGARPVSDGVRNAASGGTRDLNRQFELLKAKLDAEGLFDPARKRPIPAVPRTIGIVTSPTTAAFQDIQNVLRGATRWLSDPQPALYRGLTPPAIVAALQRSTITRTWM